MTGAQQGVPTGYAAIVDEVYETLAALPRYDGAPPRDRLPPSGIYFFFERGEVVPWRGGRTDRVVRIGSHKRDGRLRERLSYHYQTRRLSVFRKHVGGALLQRDNPSDPRLKTWLRGDGPSLPAVEARVDQRLRDDFSYACLRVDNQRDRVELERGLIALVARHSPGEPSPTWLGRYAVAERIRCSGLWNTQHVNGDRLTRDQVLRLGQLGAGSADEL